MSPVRGPVRIIIIGGTVAFLAWAAGEQFLEYQRASAAAKSGGFADIAEAKAATAKGFDKAETYRRYLDVERVEQQKRDAEAATRKAREDAEWQQSIRYVVALRKSMKNPDSFKLEDAWRAEGGIYCFEYRATNAFNALIPGRAVVGGGKAATSDQGNAFIALWNKHCTRSVENLHTLVFAFKKGYF